jgi:hypothetical protein
MPENTGNREIHLKSRPKGMPTEDHFKLMETPIPQPESGEVLVRNIFMSVNPYMRARMREGKSYVEPFQVGQPLDGGCVGQVVRSENGPLEVGAYVLGAKRMAGILCVRRRRSDPNRSRRRTHSGLSGGGRHDRHDRLHRSSEVRPSRGGRYRLCLGRGRGGEFGGLPGGQNQRLPVGWSCAG